MDEEAVKVEGPIATVMSDDIFKDTRIIAFKGLVPEFKAAGFNQSIIPA